MGFFDSLFSGFGSSSSADSGVNSSPSETPGSGIGGWGAGQPVPAGASDPVGPSAIKFVNSFESSATAGKPAISPLDTGTKAPVMQVKSGKPMIESYEASANQQGNNAEAPSADAPKTDQGGGKQAGDQQKSIEEQRRQWEFDKGIDPEAKRSRMRPADGETPPDSGYNLHRIHPKEHIEKPHRAVDIKNRKNGPVVAVSDGSVKSTGTEKNLGNHVVVDFDDGMRGVYGHTAPSVQPGQRVRKGDPVGNTDLSGATTGPHLHFEVHDPKTGNKINPEAYIPWRRE
ncbi:MAG: M23 family metallopeptidase [Acidobacteriota bacterium]